MASYEKRKSGLWSVRFPIPSADGTDKLKRLSGFKTKKEAQFAYEDFIASFRSQPLPLADQSSDITIDLTFRQIVEKFLATKKARIKPASYYDLDKKVSSRILPFFNDKVMKDITPLDILNWQNTLEEYSYRYKKHLYGYLSSIYRFAAKYYNVPNIIDKDESPHNLEGKKRMLFWTPEEFTSFIAQVDRIEYSTFFKFLYLSGCRKGEALALTWKDINFDNATVEITKSAAYKVGTGGKSYHISTPKNLSSDRTVHLPSFFMDELKAYAQWQKENTKAQTFVFGSTDPLSPTTIDRVKNKAEEKANVKHIRIHDLRHSCASYLIHKGVSIVAVSHHLGHASIKQTFDTYSHLLPADDDKLRTALSELTF